MDKDIAVRARLAWLIGGVLVAVLAPTTASAAELTRLCGFDTTFGDGPETTFPRRNESRVSIDLKLGKVRFTSPGSGDVLEPYDVLISRTSVRWSYGTPNSISMTYSIDRASSTYTVRYAQAGVFEKGGTRGVCLPKTPF